MMKNRPLPVLVASLIIMIATLAPAMADTASVERVEKGNLVLEGIPEIPERISSRLRQYQNVRSAGFSGWHPSGRGILVSTRFGETSQVHWVGQPGGSRQQITFFDEPVNGAVINPDPEVNGFIFGKDVGGSEFFQLFFFDLKTGHYRMLTDGKSRNGAAVWSRAGDRFAFYTTRRNGKDWDIHVAGIQGASKAVLEDKGTWVPIEWSYDDKKLLVLRYVSANESYPYVLDLISKELLPLNTSKKKIAYGSTAFSPDGKGIYFTSDEGSEFKTLRYFTLADGTVRDVTESSKWDVESLTLSEDGKYLVYTINEDGIETLHLMDLASGKDLPVPEIPAGVMAGIEFSPDGKQLGIYLNSSRSPGDVYSFEIGSRSLTRWTQSEVGGLDTSTFVGAELIRFPTFDKEEGKPRTIPAFYYRPEGKGPFPVIINIHGGPEGQARPVFSSSLQASINELGAAVIRPNVRGSAGYGKSYLKLDNGFKREDSVKDIGALLDWIETRPELDSERVVVSGGSYGGYMVLASMVHYSDRLRAGVDVVGISNFVTFLTNTKEYRRDLRRVEYGDERDSEMRAFLERISPTNNVKKITKPLLVAQGLNDPRVPATESEQMVAEIRKNGGDVWYMLAKDEGHGFRKKVNRDYYSNASMLFLERMLAEESASTQGE
jgi:dipeptidyl aminopeptidase/acylaminoacyl peptidase